MSALDCHTAIKRSFLAVQVISEAQKKAAYAKVERFIRTGDDDRPPLTNSICFSAMWRHLSPALQASIYMSQDDTMVRAVVRKFEHTLVFHARPVLTEIERRTRKSTWPVSALRVGRRPKPSFEYYGRMPRSYLVKLHCDIAQHILGWAADDSITKTSQKVVELALGRVSTRTSVRILEYAHMTYGRSELR